jgi:hypothetical protein
MPPTRDHDLKFEQAERATSPGSNSERDRHNHRGRGAAVCGASDWMCPTWGVVRAAALRPMFRPRNPMIKSATSATTPTTAVPTISVRLPLPVSGTFGASLFCRCVVMSGPQGAHPRTAEAGSRSGDARQRPERSQTQNGSLTTSCRQPTSLGTTRTGGREFPSIRTAPAS